MAWERKRGERTGRRVREKTEKKNPCMDSRLMDQTMQISKAPLEKLARSLALGHPRLI